MADEGGLVERLSELLASGEVPVDGRLPAERDLAERFSVSRAKLRLALDRLEKEGTIYRRQGRGTFAAPPVSHGSTALCRLAREATPQDVMEVRLEIEPALAAHAATRARNGDLARLEQLMLATIDLAERATYETADDIFHYNIAVLARNPLFLEIYDSIRTVRKLAAWGNIRRESHTPEVMAKFGEQHRALFAAISSRDGPKAARLMEEHLRDVNHMVLRGVRHSGA
ncbi:Putative L-lactate dehydrogenase operon regulatory protein [Jannaschia seosinensis]|uniref:Putative L-lactate dehydrogenase operon regulatory protein n=1 Tax=Jannaschia seosinensis TaxID=313367 RepID=A0A0M7BCV6_9RHOB|nr:FCD domain-containing protein [Jannaschia seosinensis]CUH40221.1 Putative L-lactate dehydrogenase operon regulatory protein [Jannaschia seosinensis]